MKLGVRGKLLSVTRLSARKSSGPVIRVETRPVTAAEQSWNCVRAWTGRP
jgi:hypothetical protein